MSEGGRTWPIPEAWTAAAEVVGAAYNVDPAVIVAGSRGRGPRPPKGVWEAKKVSVHLAVLLAGCDYAELGRHTGLHRDTVASHCAAVRKLSVGDRDELDMATLEMLARARLGQFERQRIDALRAQLSLLSATVSISSDRHPTVHPTVLEPSQKCEDDAP